MNVKFSNLLPGLLSAMMIMALSASAQDETPVPGPTNTGTYFNVEPSTYDEKPLLMEQDSRTKNLNVVPNDSTQVRPLIPGAKQKATDPKKPQAEGDPLNFNFLYYIIQKFKASDLMME